MINDASVATYRADGYLKVDGLLGASDLSLIEAMVQSMASSKPDAVVAAGGTQNYQQSAAFRSALDLTHAPSREHPEIAPIIERLAGVACRLLGVGSVHVWEDKIFRKPKATEGGRATYWHQDLPRLPFDRRGFLTIWVAVRDVPLARGPLSFVPGSHRVGPLGAIDQIGVEASLDELLRDDDRVLCGDPVASDMSAGDATIHDGLMLHRGGENTTSEDRVAWAVSYFPSDTLYTGLANSVTDGLSLPTFEPFPIEHFPAFAVD